MPCPSPVGLPVSTVRIALGKAVDVAPQYYVIMPEERNLAFRKLGKLIPGALHCQTLVDKGHVRILQRFPKPSQGEQSLYLGLHLVSPFCVSFTGAIHDYTGTEYVL
jgi:hypothetical protein